MFCVAFGSVLPPWSPSYSPATAARAPAGVVIAFLAGYGVLALVARRGAVARALVTGAVLGASFVELFHPALLGRPFRDPADLLAWAARPPAAVLGLYRNLEPGPVLDLPFTYHLRGKLQDMAYYIFLGAYHGQPVAACYNSFEVPLQKDVAQHARNPRSHRPLRIGWMAQ